MSSNFRTLYRLSDEYARIAIAALFLVTGGALIASIFFSPTFVLGLLFFVIVLVVTFIRPTWALAFLLLYLPFEPFILKWIPDDIYLYARFFSETLVYLLVASLFWKRITSQIRLQQTPIDLPMILFVLLLITTTVINVIHPIDAMLGMRQILRFMLLFFITVYLAPTKKWMSTVFKGILVVVAIQLTLGYGQALIGERLDSFLLPSEVRTFGEITITQGTVQFWDPGKRVFGTMGRYDQLGIFLAFFLLMIVAILYEPQLKEKYGRYLMPLLLLALPVLAMSYSRSAWFGFLLGFLFLAIVIHRDKRVTIGLGVMAVIITGYLMISGLVVNRLIDTAEQGLTERFFEAFSYERWRGEYYGIGRLFWMVQTIKEVVPAAPLFGHGPAMYGAGAVAALGNTAVYDELGLPFGVYGTEGYIDNNWFSLWGETGTLGLGVYIWLYLSLFFMCLRVYRASNNPETRALALGVAAAMLAASLNAFLASFLEVRTLAVYLWVAPALVLVQSQKEKLKL